jgi:hypothetical protein
MPDDRKGGIGETRRDVGDATRPARGPGPGGPGVITPERLADLWGPETVAVPPWTPQGAPFQQARMPSPAAPSPPGWQAAPATWASPGGIPNWPTPPPQRRRPRRRWAGLLSTLITLALAAGVWIYVYQRTHDKLEITGVRVTVANLPLKCNGTADIIGTISTNGYGGPISYQWVRGTDQPMAALVADDASGSHTVQVRLNWTFHGKGTGNAVAKLNVVTPGPGAESSITFPYSCRL